MTFLMSGTRMSGCVFRQKETIETTMKNTDTTPVTLKLEAEKKVDKSATFQGFYPRGLVTPHNLQGDHGGLAQTLDSGPM